MIFAVAADDPASSWWPGSGSQSNSVSGSTSASPALSRPGSGLCSSATCKRSPGPRKERLPVPPSPQQDQAKQVQEYTPALKIEL